MADTPSAMQLRLLQIVADDAAETNSTLVMPFPVELLRFFDKATTTATSDTNAAKNPIRDPPHVVAATGDLPAEDRVPGSEPGADSDNYAPQSAPGLPSL